MNQITSSSSTSTKRRKREISDLNSLNLQIQVLKSAVEIQQPSSASGINSIVFSIYPQLSTINNFIVSNDASFLSDQANTILSVVTDLKPVVSTLSTSVDDQIDVINFRIECEGGVSETTTASN